MAFVNTLSGRGTPEPKEGLVSSAALIDWARGASILSASATADLCHRAAAHPQEADRALAAARDLRETLHQLFSAIDMGKSPSEPVLATLAAYLGGGFKQARLVFQEGMLQWAPGVISGLDDVTREVARAAARLVGSGHLARVRACAAEDCRWWFVDDTKNRSRRWCDMKTCGNRAKLRRYRARRPEEKSEK